MKLLDKVITMLQNDIPLEEKYRDHELKGKYQGFKECHIQPDTNSDRPYTSTGNNPTVSANL